MGQNDIAEQEKVKNLIKAHIAHTDSTVGKNMLANWKNEIKHFVKVYPVDYKRVLDQQNATLLTAKDGVREAVGVCSVGGGEVLGVVAKPVERSGSSLSIRPPTPIAQAQDLIPEMKKMIF